MIDSPCAPAGTGRRIASLTLAVLLVACAAASPSRAAAAGPVPAGCGDATVVPTTAAMRQAAAATIFCLVNGERARRGLAPLTPSRLLARAAAVHSLDMVRKRYFAHVSPTGQGVRQRVARTGYLRRARRATLGETIAWGTDYYGSPASLVQDLMSSAQHNAIVTSRRFRDVGVGLALGAPMDGMGSGVTLSLTFGRR